MILDMILEEFKKDISDEDGKYPALFCDEYCKYPEIVNNEGYSEDKFFDELMTRYCDDCPLNKIFN